ncbi:MAG: transketolase [Planctomycetota bacterium]|jgi:transketolase|nr:transketolase [Planctomycetota bacterium]
MPDSPVLQIKPPSPELAAKIANTIRFLSADAVQKANSGHPGAPMGMAEIATVLLTRFLRIDPKDEKWSNRDRFVLSSGHACMLLYSMLYFQGYLTLEDLTNFRQLGSRTPGHPEYGEVPGVEATTGPLGAGFSMAVGMSIGERMLAETYNTPKFDVVDHFTYVLMGDGCHMEGITNEAASLAGHLRLGRLIVLYDDNHITIEGDTSLAFTENVGQRYEALNWHVQHIDGHDCQAIAQAIEAAQSETTRPSLIVARTIIGKGAPTKAGSHHVHGAPIGDAEIAAGKAAIGFPNQPFYVPPEVAEYFEVRRGELHALRQDWNQLFGEYEKKHRSSARELIRVLSGELPKQWKKAVPEFPSDKALASRSSGGQIMNKLGTVLPELVGGSADLAPSNNTEIKTGASPDFIGPGSFLGRNIHFGVREHAMGGVLNGLALHGGFIPYGGTFMVFHDYMRGAVRLSSLMRLRTIFVYTHDSFYVGEDGPTHEPVEHLAALRALPRLHVWRPADANEAIYAWQAAIERRDGPSVLALTRQNLPTLDRNAFAPARESLKGMYILWSTLGKPLDVLIVATGSEVHLGLAVAKALAEEGRGVRVVSAPCLEAFALQPEGYRKKVLPRRPRKRLVLEAGIIQGWEGIMGETGLFVGMDDFGISGPANQVAAKLGFTPEAVLTKIREAGW